MAWNEPGNSGDKRSNDPWSGKGKDQGPPDLDEALRKLQRRLGSIFSSGGGNQSEQPGGGLALGVIGFLVVLVWFLAGIFIVDPAEEAVVLRFGRYVKTVGPGPHWIPRFIDSKQVVNVQKVDNLKLSDAMLNKDENIVSATVAIQYRVGNPRDYLFNVTDPRESLKQATASSLRQVIGHTTLDEVLTIGREKVRTDVSKLLNEILERYKTGLAITDVAMLPIKAPEEVKDAFDDAIKAQEDERRYKNQAQAYAASIEPKAEGQASRLLQEADAYKQKAILKAEGDVARFAQLLPEYERAPKVTKDRLYIDAWDQVLSQTSKILVDTKGSNNLLYLPLQNMLSQMGNQADAKAPLIQLEKSTTQQTSNNRSNRYSSVRQGRDSYRGRGTY